MVDCANISLARQVLGTVATYFIFLFQLHMAETTEGEAARFNVLKRST